MKLAFLTCIYPDARPYWRPYIESLKNQTHRDFTLFLACDGFKPAASEVSGLPVEMRDFQGTPVQVRKDALKWCAEEGIDGIIWGDADDIFTPNRVERFASAFKTHPLIFHDMTLFSENPKLGKPMIGNRLRDGQLVTAQDVVEFNLLGLSNTGFKTDLIQGHLNSIPDHLVAFDWTFFSLIMTNGTNAYYMSEALTEYRQHPKSLTSIESPSPESIRLAVKVKSQHFEVLAQSNPKLKSLASSFKNLEIMLKANGPDATKYVQQAMSRQKPGTLWWELAKP